MQTSSPAGPLCVRWQPCEWEWRGGSPEKQNGGRRAALHVRFYRTAAELWAAGCWWNDQNWPAFATQKSQGVGVSVWAELWIPPEAKQREILGSIKGSSHYIMNVTFLSLQLLIYSSVILLILLRVVQLATCWLQHQCIMKECDHHAHTPRWDTVAALFDLRMFFTLGLIYATWRHTGWNPPWRHQMHICQTCQFSHVVHTETQTRSVSIEAKLKFSLFELVWLVFTKKKEFKLRLSLAVIAPLCSVFRLMMLVLQYSAAGC